MSAPPSLFIGLMSGTSADGIDAALVDFESSPTLRAALSVAWPDAVRQTILAMAQGDGAVTLDALGALDTTIARHFASAAQALLERAGIDAAAVRAIGSHGQTVRHRPSGARPFTMQLGDSAVIAELTGIDCVADFRRADIAAGGQGAPLVPAFHASLFAKPRVTQVVLNLGGIANITVLHGDGHVTGFDTGPGNALLDAWAQRHVGSACDIDGMFAARGRVDANLLAALLDEPYFALAPPKSTGRELFQMRWLDARLAGRTLATPDVQATLVALTVRSVADAMATHAAAAERVLVCGGGVHNPVLMTQLTSALAPREVRDTGSAGVDPDHVEAMAFAWLARERLAARPANLPAVTGAHGPRVLGSVALAPKQR